MHYSLRGLYFIYFFSTRNVVSTHIRQAGLSGLRVSQRALSHSNSPLQFYTIPRVEQLIRCEKTDIIFIISQLSCSVYSRTVNVRLLCNSEVSGSRKSKQTAPPYYSAFSSNVIKYHRITSNIPSSLSVLSPSWEQRRSAYEKKAVFDC